MPGPMTICIEGIDGCGKTTQAQLLKTKLEEAGRKVTLCHDPGSTTLAKEIRTILLNVDVEMDAEIQMLLFTAARASLARKIEKMLEEGYDVLLDRWVLSTYLYQGKLGGISFGEINNLHAAYVRVNPDVYIVLDLPVADALKRAGQVGDSNKDRFESKGVEFQQKLRDAYVDLATRGPSDIELVSGIGVECVVADRVANACKRWEGWPDGLL